MFFAYGGKVGAGVDPLDLKPIVEVAYLNQENTWRYRAIVRYCYERHEKMQTYVYPEELFAHLTQDAQFATYTFEQLEQDLKQLVEWKNLLPRQETGRARTIDDFKRRKYRYQCSPYTVEIERLVQNLKAAGKDFGGSLEATQFERLLGTLRRLLTQGLDLPEAELNQTWIDFYGYFTSMVQNASDYLAHLKSSKVEERMMLDSFLIYKDTFTQYLQNFVLGLQRCSYQIEDAFRRADAASVESLTDRLAAYQLSVPRLGTQRTREAFKAEYGDRYAVVRAWFLGAEHRTSEMRVLQQETTETIRRIARFAQRLAEQQQSFRSRKQEYLYLAAWFQRCASLEEAHLLGAMVFGASHTRHLYAEERASEDMDARVEDEPPTQIILQPRARAYKEKVRRGAVGDHAAQQRELRQAYLRRLEAHDAMIDRLVVDGRIDLGALPRVLPEVRKTLLGWVARCMQQQTRSIRTETGRSIRLIEGPKGVLARLESDDGVFFLPMMQLEITQRGSGNGGD